MTGIVLVHLSDLHFGSVAELDALEDALRFIVELAPSATVISGDLTMRARHGEFAAARLYIDRLKLTAPVLAVPGNHDTQWWQSPLTLLGNSRMHYKYRRWFGEDLTPVLQIPGAVIAGALSANGIAPGSLSRNPNDIAVKGNLPASETRRLTRIFEAAPAGAYRVAVLHHNVLPGRLSDRMGLAHWRSAGQRLVATGADLVLCGHDHEEGAGLLNNQVVVSTANTLSTRTRGARPASFNVIRLQSDRIEIEFQVWDTAARRFASSERHAFARPQHSADRTAARR
ncbi:MAG: metallophosphoesterase [Gemmatimonadota bacterium]